MTPICIYADEDVHGAVWRGLRRLGIDATSIANVHRLGLPDDEQLVWAASNNRAFLTHNVEDFPRIHYEFLSAGKHHAGIIVSRQDLSIGEIIRRVAHLTATRSSEEMRDRIEYLSGW